MNRLFSYRKRDLILLLLLSLGFLFSFVHCSLAIEGLSVSPAIIDKQVKARDVLEYSLILKNETKRKFILYPLVYDISILNGQKKIVDPSLLDKSVSPTRWIRIQRSRIELLPYSQKSVPLKIEVNLEAKSGNYHALIIFAQGASKPEAEKNAKKFNFPQTLINLEVVKNIIEKVEIQRFYTDKNFYIKPSVRFYLDLANIGNQEILPRISLIVYNGRGKEVAFLKARKVSNLLPGVKRTFTENWDFKKALGKYKAQVLVEYGNNFQKELNDVVYFWIFPWQFLALVFGGIIFSLFFFIALLFSSLKRHHIKSNHQDKSKSQTKSITIDLRKF